MHFIESSCRLKPTLRVFRTMKHFIGPLILLLVPLLTAYGQDSVNGTSTVTFGLGAGKPIGAADGITGGTQLNGSYEYRIRKYLSVEFGVDSTIVTAPIYTYTNTFIPVGSGLTGPYTYTTTYSHATSRATTMPFGFRGVLPLLHGRVEASVGGGGAFLWNPRLYFSSQNGWGWQGNLSVRMALDQKRHFWLGSTGRFIDSRGAYPSQWVVWSADLGYRFGGR
jgi:hypothetical protein